MGVARIGMFEEAKENYRGKIMYIKKVIIMLLLQIILIFMIIMITAAFRVGCHRHSGSATHV